MAKQDEVVLLVPRSRKLTLECVFQSA
jgi:hypothetical protein